MTIAGPDELIDALGNNSSRILVDKASISNAAATQLHSLWRATGQPGQGAIPTAVAVCSMALAGAIQFTPQTAPATSYWSWATMTCSNGTVGLELHDRLAHMGGLNGTLATAQTVGLDLLSLLATSNLDARKGDALYSDVSWFLEWYADTGGTAVTATVNVTYSDGTTGNLSAISLAATRRASFMVPLNGLIPAGVAGKYIRGVNSVTLSATTGAAGNFGVTATRNRTTMPILNANWPHVFDWAQLGQSEIMNDACLFLIQSANTTSTGTVRGQAKIAHG